MSIKYSSYHLAVADLQKANAKGGAATILFGCNFWENAQNFSMRSLCHQQSPSSANATGRANGIHMQLKVVTFISTVHFSPSSSPSALIFNFYLARGVVLPIQESSSRNEIGFSRCTMKKVPAPKREGVCYSTTLNP